MQRFAMVMVFTVPKTMTSFRINQARVLLNIATTKAASHTLHLYQLLFKLHILLQHHFRIQKYEMHALEIAM